MEATPHMPALQSLMEAHPDEAIIDCAEIAASRKQGQRIPLNYLVAMLRAPPPAVAPAGTNGFAPHNGYKSKTRQAMETLLVDAGEFVNPFGD